MKLVDFGHPRRALDTYFKKPAAASSFVAAPAAAAAVAPSVARVFAPLSPAHGAATAEEAAEDLEGGAAAAAVSSPAPPPPLAIAWRAPPSDNDVMLTYHHDANAPLRSGDSADSPVRRMAIDDDGDGDCTGDAEVGDGGLDCGDWNVDGASAAVAPRGGSYPSPPDGRWQQQQGRWSPTTTSPSAGSDREAKRARRLDRGEHGFDVGDVLGALRASGEIAAFLGAAAAPRQRGGVVGAFHIRIP